MENQSYKAIVNEQLEFNTPNGQQLDIIPDGNGAFHVLNDSRAYRAEIVRADFANKSFVIKVNGNTYEIKLEDQYDQLIKQLGLGRKVQHKVDNIKSPMPGLVLSVSVEPGQAVEKGDALLILEAMKMENVIKSPGSGVVKTVKVQQGEAVEKGHLLIEME